MKRELNKNISNNEVYYTACSLLVILKSSCSELHCKRDLIHFSFPMRFVEAQLDLDAWMSKAAAPDLTRLFRSSFFV